MCAHATISFEDEISGGGLNKELRKSSTPNGEEEKRIQSYIKVSVLKIFVLQI